MISFSIRRRLKFVLKERQSLPWKLGLAFGFVAQQRCMRLRNPAQADGRQRGTALRSGRTPFTTFTMICRILFSPKGKNSFIIEKPSLMYKCIQNNFESFGSCVKCKSLMWSSRKTWHAMDHVGSSRHQWLYRWLCLPVCSDKGMWAVVSHGSIKEELSWFGLFLSASGISPASDSEQTGWGLNHRCFNPIVALILFAGGGGRWKRKGTRWFLTF